MKNNRIFASLFLIAGLFFITSCQSTSKVPLPKDFEIPVQAFIPDSYSWEKAAEGIESTQFSTEEFAIKYQLVKIDLHTPGLQLVYFPEEKDFAGSQNFDSYFKSQKTSGFGKKNNLIVAVNASPYEVKKSNSFYSYISKQRKIRGIHKADNLILSSSVEKYSALAFKKVKSGKDSYIYKATVYENQKDNSFKDEDFVFGGFFTILKKGQVRSFSANSHDARTAAGISKDDRYLYLLAVNGGNFSKNFGLSYPECAEIFKNLGCKEAIEFDGGNSTQMFLKGKTVTDSLLVNTQASSFGFRINK